jgi:hypothetical protein
VNSILNPILVACLGLGYFFNIYRGKPLVREGGVLVMTHPTPWEFNPVHHPSYIDFFEQVLSETTDPIEVAERFEESFATDPWYIHLYRTGHAYHGVHPFYMWYWCAHALQHLGASSSSAATRRGAPSRVPGRLHPGRRARDGPRRGRALADADPPARPPDPHGRRAVTPATPEKGSSNSLRPKRAVRTDAALGSSGERAGGGAIGILRGLAPSALVTRAGRAPLPAGRTELAGVGPRPPPDAGAGRATTTPTGPVATRCAWPGPWSSTT